MTARYEDSRIRHSAIQQAIEAHIAGLVDKPVAKREQMLTAEQRARRRAAQAAREEREANKEPWE